MKTETQFQRINLCEYFTLARCVYIQVQPETKEKSYTKNWSNKFQTI